MLTILKIKDKKTVFFLILILIFLIFKIFIFDIKTVKGRSMENTLKEGNLVFIFKAAYGIKFPSRNYYLVRWAFPKVNDIIVYRKGGHFAVKRCIGISDMPIDFSFNSLYNGLSDYKMTIGERSVNLSAAQFRNLGGRLENPARKIPKDTVLALGDNPDSSYDSRDYGFVSADSIYGKVITWK